MIIDLPDMSSLCLVINIYSLVSCVQERYFDNIALKMEFVNRLRTRFAKTFPDLTLLILKEGSF